MRPTLSSGGERVISNSGMGWPASPGDGIKDDFYGGRSHLSEIHASRLSFNSIRRGAHSILHAVYASTFVEVERNLPGGMLQTCHTADHCVRARKKAAMRAELDQALDVKSSRSGLGRYHSRIIGSMGDDRGPL